MRALRFAALAVFLASAAACGGDGDPTGPIPSSLAGTWEAHSGCIDFGCAFTIISTANPADSLNLIFAGAELEIQIRTSGSFRLHFDWSEETTSTGTARVEGNILLVEAPGNPPTVDSIRYLVSGNRLQFDFLEIRRIVDFDGDDQPDPSTVRAVLRRR